MIEPIGIKQNVSLKEFTWWKVGGCAEYYIAPTTVAELQTALMWARSKQLRVRVLGGGSNVLIADQGVNGLVVHSYRLTELRSWYDAGYFWIWAQAGVPKTTIMKLFLEAQLAPAEFLTGLPGDVGGGVAMNAGVGEFIVPREFAEITKQIEVIDVNDPATVRTFEASKLQWQYRAGPLQAGAQICVAALLSWPDQPDAAVKNRVKAKNQQRRRTQPLNLATAGSTFRNPLPHKAGALIEDCGLKGFQLGGAQVSTLHANFIVNAGQASAQDIDDLISHIQQVVLQKHGIQLTPEVHRMP